MSAWLLNDPYQKIFQTDAKTCLESKRIIVYNMAIGVVEFSREGYKIRKVFA